MKYLAFVFTLFAALAAQAITTTLEFEDLREISTRAAVSNDIAAIVAPKADKIRIVPSPTADDTWDSETFANHPLKYTTLYRRESWYASSSNAVDMIEFEPNDTWTYSNFRLLNPGGSWSSWEAYAIGPADATTLTFTNDTTSFVATRSLSRPLAITNAVVYADQVPDLASGYVDEAISQYDEELRGDFADVAFSGSYDDLSDKPDIPEIPDETDPQWLADKPDYATLSALAATGSVVKAEALSEIASATNALPAWTKTASKPTYTASEVMAIPYDYIDSSDIIHTSEFISFDNDVIFGEHAAISVSTNYLWLGGKRYTGVSTFLNDAGYLIGTLDSLTNNVAFTNAVAAVSPPTDLSDYYTAAQVQEAITAAVAVALSNALVNVVFYDPATSNLTYRTNE